MKKAIYILILLTYCNSSFAQISIDRQVIGTTGNLTNTGAIRASATSGETAIQTFSQSSLIITQGFQQSDTLSITTSVNSENVSLINITAYPNPTMNKVILDFAGNETIEIKIEVYNALGQLIQQPLNKIIQKNCTQELNFSQYYSGNYFIVVKSNDGKLNKFFKVQKIN